MASSEAVALERLGRADVDAAGSRLSDGARLEPDGRDWAFFVDHGERSACATTPAELVASAATLPYDGGVGWISMVLVDAVPSPPRNRDAAARRRAVEALRGAGRVPVLDATPAGAAVYRRCGFAAGFVFERWEGDTDCADEGAASANREGDSDIAGVVEVADERAVDRAPCARSFGRSIGRAPLLRDFLARPGTRAWLAADASGFVVARVGRRAHQLGPIVADDAASAFALANAALASVRGPVFIDVPVARAGARRTHSRSAASRASVRSCAWRWATRRRSRRARASSRSPARSSADDERCVFAAPLLPPRRCARACSRAWRFPAHPLALDASRRLDRRRQRALARYYLDAGAGGLAVGVHTTQFAIREAGLFEEVLALAAETARDWPRLGRTRARDRSSSPARAAARSRRSPRRASRAGSATTRCCSASRRCKGASEDELDRALRSGRAPRCR